MKNKDNLHFSWNKALSYNKVWNFAIGERESGKSVDSWSHIWNAFKYESRPSIVLRRRIADITSTYIDDIETLLNKFLDEKIQLLYLKGDVKSGVVDVAVGEYGKDYSWQQIKKLPVFFRLIGLSNPMSRIKSLMLPNIKYIFFDEFICNLRGQEKYLGDEFFLIKEIYTTYNRESSTSIRILAAANPYSVYCPLFIGLGVDTLKLKPGAFIVGDNYVIDCFKVPDELKQKILDFNPMYQFDEAYKRYAFGGENINDQNIKIQKTEPCGLKMKYIFKFGREFLSIHEGTSRKQTESFWCCKHKEDWLQKIGKRRNIIVFDFADMCEGSRMIDASLRINLFRLKDAINKRNITYNCVDASYMMEDIYNCI